MGRGTVTRYLQADSCPFHADGYTMSSKLDPYRDYLEKRWQAGCQNGMELWRELERMGFAGSRGIVARWAASKRQTLPVNKREPIPRYVPPWPPSRAAWLFIKQESGLSVEERDPLGRMCQASEKAKQAYSLGQTFT